MIKNSTKLINKFSKVYFEHIFKQKNSFSANYLSRKLTTYKMTSYKYPEVRRDPSIVDDIHGVKVSIFFY
jgi:hypothetical protein